MGKTIYLNKRNETRNKIDDVFIESLRSSGYTDLTVKEICERAGINRSTFYVYYKDTVDMREQIEDRLITRFESRMKTVVDRYFDDPDKIMSEIMAFNRENGYLPLLLNITSGSFAHRISRTAAGFLAAGHGLTDDSRESIALLFIYHLAGISMVVLQMKENTSPSEDCYEKMSQKISEIIQPVLEAGFIQAIKNQISQPT